jgi:hypothetical protein
MRTSKRITEAIRSVHGEEYRFGPVADLYGELPIIGLCINYLFMHNYAESPGEATGSSIDFANGALGVKYSFGVELRDTGMFGHLLPPSLIEETAEENFAGLLELAMIVLEEGNAAAKVAKMRKSLSNQS